MAAEKQIKIVTFTPVYGRHNILAIMLKGLKRLINYKPQKYSIQPFFIVSNSADEAIIRKAGYPFLLYKNLPLGEKKNAGLNYALKNFQFDYLMEIGSDDLLTNSYLDFISPELEKGTPLFNLSTCYFYEVGTGEKAVWTTNVVMGAGRCISRKALELTQAVEFRFTTSMAGPDVSYQPKTRYYLPIKTATHYQNCAFGNTTGEQSAQLWNNTANSGMDTASMNTLARFGIENQNLETDQVFALDLKSNTNIHAITEFKPTRKDVLKPFPEKTAIKKLLTASPLAKGEQNGD